MIISRIWFDDAHVYGASDDGRVFRQSLLWYPRLRQATEVERSEYTFGRDGIHWRKLNEDISFESFEYEDSEPTPLQSFFLRHSEINVQEFAKTIGINYRLLNNYINGFSKPSADVEHHIMEMIDTIKH